MIITTTLLGVLGWFLIPYIYSFTHSSYDRRGIEQICDEIFGNDTNIKDALTEEVMIVAYEYNTHEPRLFTKFTANIDPELYNVTITDAAQASSSAPTYFDPKVIGNQVLVDGGVIANEPALYAYLHSQYSLNKTNIRLISVGTGMANPQKVDPKNINTVTWLENLGTFLTTTEQFTHEYLLDLMAKDYYRFQAALEKNLGLDAISDEDIQTLKDEGQKVVQKNKDDIQKAIRSVVDQKVSKKYSCPKDSPKDSL